MPKSTAYIAACSSCEQGGIYSFSIEKDFTQTGFTQVSEVSYIILSPDKKKMYASIRQSAKDKTDGEVAAFAINEDDSLSLLNVLSSGGLSSCHLAVNGNYLYCPNYSGGSLAEYKLAGDGSLEKRTQLIQHQGNSVHPTRQTEAHPHCTVMSPDGKYLCVVDLGCDAIFLYPADPENGLGSTPAHVCKTTPGDGPRHIIFNEKANLAYVINELGCSISVYTYSNGQMELKQNIPTLPDTFHEKNTCAAIRISQDGKYLLGSNRGHESIAVYNILADGTLTLQNIVSVKGKGPRDFDLLASDRILAVTNEDSGTFDLFSSPLNDACEMKEIKSMGFPRPLCVLELKH